MKKTFISFILSICACTFAVAAESNYCIAYSTSSKGSNQWDDQANYELSTAMTKGQTYTLSLKVKATEACSLCLWPIWNASSNKNQYGGSNDIQYLDAKSVSTQWQTLSWVFTASFNNDGLDLPFGGLNGTIYFDDVKLIDNAVGVNMVLNGDFAENSTKGWSSKSAYRGTSYKIVDSDSGKGAPEPDEPEIPETWEYAQQGNPNFHIYLCFGQSNMEGATKPEAQDKTGIPANFKMMSAVNGTTRKKGKWYSAVPPLCREENGLTPADYFGRYLAEQMPNDTIGVINVAAGGAKIELFMVEKKDAYIAGEQSWFQNICAKYDNDPFGRLVEMGKEAQKVGVIKGILLHQGESNNGEATWAEKVAKVYTRLCYYLGLNPADVPLLAGETLYENMGGGCSWHNTAALPKLKETIPNSFVISADGCTGNGVDAWHFSCEGYRKLGRRYGETMYKYLKSHTGIEERTIDETEQTQAYYDLSGRKVSQPSTPGIYCKNGRMIMVR